MLEVDRRTALCGLLAFSGADWVPSAHAAGGGISEAFPKSLEALFALDAAQAWLVTRRLEWSGRWPSRFLCSEVLAPPQGQAIHEPAVRIDLPTPSVLALFGSGRGVRNWRTVGGTATIVCGVRMTACAGGGQLACLLQPHGAPVVTGLRIIES